MMSDGHGARASQQEIDKEAGRLGWAGTCKIPTQT